MAGTPEVGRLAGLLQEGPAAPHALLVHGLKVGLASLRGGKKKQNLRNEIVLENLNTAPTWLDTQWAVLTVHHAAWP